MDIINLTSAIRSQYDCGLSVEARVCCDSRTVKEGGVFVAVRGVHADGHSYIDEAVRRGAGVVVAERPVQVPESVELVLVDNAAEVLGELAQTAAGSPGERMTVLGVTGTNGKTTVAYLVRAILNRAGIGCGMVGTVGYDIGEKQVLKADNTTPDSVRLAEMMRRMVNNGLEAMVMECSSHGLDQHRTAGICFDAAAFTNLSGDHLDYHGTTEAYLAAKRKLFENLRPDSIAVLNALDPVCENLLKATEAKVWRYGIDTDVEISAQVKDQGLWGCDLELSVLGEKSRMRIPLIGYHNVSNCLAALGLARAANVTTGTMVEAVGEFPGVPGRLERIECGRNFTVLVDYAHTDDALDHALKTLRELTGDELIVVFGCGGERDRTKRPRMARVAETWADKVVVTSDNPRREDPEQIFADIRLGFSPTGRDKVVEIADRREAIAQAIRQARSGDVVLIAGKGHEDYQQIGEQYLRFDDREVVREILTVSNYTP